jgi:hypothetical protein
MCERYTFLQARRVSILVVEATRSHKEWRAQLKQILALITALVVTTTVGLGMLAIGVNAATNPNSVPVSNSPNSAVAASNVPANAQTQNAQLNDVITQYQNREKQYQAQINQLNNLIKQYQSREQQYQTQLDQVTSQEQALQSILVQLQQRRIIRILNDGTVQLLVGRGGDGE